MTATLSFALPTYNRASFLDAALARLIAQVAPYGLRILVSDNRSTDDTAAVVARHATTYPFLDYVCNAENLGPDGNFEAVLCQSTGDYVWLLGDTYAIEDAALDQVLTAIGGERAFDAVVVNIKGRGSAIPGRLYTDRATLLAELGWHMTCMAALILHRAVIEDGAFQRYRGTSFIHIGIVFDYIADHHPAVLWIDDAGVMPLTLPGQIKTSVWEQRTFDIWVDSWTAFVMSLPAVYPLEAKLSCILRHGECSGLFSFPKLVKLRARGILTLAAVRVRWTALRLATGQRRFAILAFALLPAGIARFAVRIRNSG